MGGTAFAAPGAAGEDGDGTISGFAISNIAFNLDTTDPTLVDSVTFMAQSAAASGWPASLTTSVARFTTTASAWYICTDDAGGAASGTYVITCSTTGTGFHYDGITPQTQMTMLAAVEFDTVIDQ